MLIGVNIKHKAKQKIQDLVIANEYMHTKIIGLQSSIEQLQKQIKEMKNGKKES